MTRRVLDVGQCNPDHAAISRSLNEHFDVEIVRVHGESDRIGVLQSGDFDLVRINQKLDRDYNEVLSILETIKSDSAMSHVAVMLVSSFPEAQESAMAAGAVCGVGKAEVGNPDVVQRLGAILGFDE